MSARSPLNSTSTRHGRRYIATPGTSLSLPSSRMTSDARKIGRRRSLVELVRSRQGWLASRIRGARQGLYGSTRANELATVDRRYDGKTLIIADLSNDATYAEPLFERLGRRLIGVRISRHGDGMTPEWWPVKNGGVWVYTIGRTYLLDLLHTQLRNDGTSRTQRAARIRAADDTRN